MQPLPKKKEKIIKENVMIGVHKVNGNKLAIDYLRDTNARYVESLFFFAKKYGVSSFEWAGDMYQIRKNMDLNFTLIKISTEENKSMECFRKKENKKN